MHTDNVVRPVGRRGNLVNVEIGGVGGEDRTRLGDLVEFGKNAFFDLHVFINSLDDEVAIG
jgi:hypothetical protein